MQEAHGHGGDTELGNSGRHLLGRLLGQIQQHPATGQNPFRHFEAVRCGYRRLRRVEEQVVALLLDVGRPPEGQKAAKPLRGHERHLDSAPFEDDVGAEGRGMGHPGDIGRVDAGALEHVGDGARARRRSDHREWSGTCPTPAAGPVAPPPHQ